MTKFKKVLLASAATVMTVAIAIGGTMAYLTSEDSDVNVMTLGNVKIEQVEQERDENGNLTQFAQAKPAFPAVYEKTEWDDDKLTVNGGEYKVFSDDMKNVIDKIVTVNNIGKSDAYVRTIVAIEAPNGDPKDLIHFNWNSTDTEISNGIVTTIDGVDYYIVAFTYKEALVAGEKSAPSLVQLFLDKATTNEDCALFGETWDVKVVSQAVQTKGFENAQVALDEAFGSVSEEKALEWFGDLEAPTVVSNEEGLVNALAGGKDVIMTEKIKMEAATTAPYGNKYAVKQDGQTIDGGNNELYMECYGDDYGIMTSGGTIKNLTIQEGCRAIMLMYANQDVILDNVNIGGDGVLYPINTGEAGEPSKVNLIVTNSTLAGWTSFGNINSASFTNVKFEQGTYYNNIYGRVLKPYVNTTLTDCEFVEHMNLDLSSLTQGHKIIFENCTVNGQKVTASTLQVPANDADYDTMLFSVDLPSWANSIADCVIFK